MSSRAIPTYFLNASRDGDSTTALNSLCQRFTAQIQTREKCGLGSSLEDGCSTNAQGGAESRQVLVSRAGLGWESRQGQEQGAAQRSCWEHTASQDLSSGHRVSFLPALPPWRWAGVTLPDLVGKWYIHTARQAQNHGMVWVLRDPKAHSMGRDPFTIPGCSKPGPA